MRIPISLFTIALSCVLSQAASINWTNHLPNVQVETNAYIGTSVNVGAGFADARIYPDSGPAVTPFRLQSTALRLSGNIFEVSNGPGFLILSSDYAGLLSAPDLLLTGDAYVQGTVRANDVVATNAITSSTLAVTNWITASNVTASVNGIINVKCPPYNAKGDGITDDTTAINNALTNKNVYFPAGSYVVSNLIVATNGATLFGDGIQSSLLSKGGSTGYLLECGTNTVILRDLDFSGGSDTSKAVTSSPGTRSGIHCVSTNTTTPIWFTRLRVHGFDNIGIGYNGTVNVVPEGPTIESCDVYYCWTGIDTGVGAANGGEYSRIANSSVWNCRNGVIVDSGNVLVECCSIISNAHGVIVAGNVTNGSHGSVVGCSINHNTIYSLAVTNCNYGFNISGNSIFYGDIAVTGSRGVNIVNNLFYGLNIGLTNNTATTKLRGNWLATDSTITKTTDSSLVIDNPVESGLALPNTSQSIYQGATGKTLIYGANPFAGTETGNYYEYLSSQVGVVSTNAYGANVGGVLGLAGYFSGSLMANFAALRGGKENGTVSDYNGYLGLYTLSSSDAKLREKARLTSGGYFGVGTLAPSSHLHSAGSFAESIATGTTVTLGATNDIYLCNVDAQTVYLPSPVGVRGRNYTIKLIAPALTGTVSTNGAGTDLIEGAGTYSLTASNKFVHVISDNANWWIIGNN